MNDVFISYATSDRKQALAICEAIESRGPRCWIACRDVQPGENYQEAIVQVIRVARAMVLVFSDRANNSDEIKKELSLASRYRIPLLALRIEDVEPSDAFAYELSTRQWIDLFADWERSIDALIRRIETVARPEEGSAPPSAASDTPRPRLAPPIPPRRRPGWPMLTGIGLAVLALAALGGWLLLRPGPAAEHSMQVRFACFEPLSPDLPGSLPDAVREEMIAAFGEDGTIGISSADQPPPGTAPAYAIAGTLRRDGGKVRVIMHLANERTGATLWSYNFTADETPTLPRRIAVNVGNMVRCGLFGASTYPKVLPDAVLADYLRACHYGGVIEFEPDRSLDFARRVTAAAPDFSWGWSAVGVATVDAAFERPSGERRPFLDEGLRAVDTAIRIDPANSEALSTRSLLIDRNDLAGREALLQAALRAHPLACACEHHSYGNLLQMVGREQDAIKEYERGVDVLPLNEASRLALARSLMLAGRIDQARTHVAAARDIAVDPETLPSFIIATAPLSRDYAAALKELRVPGIPAPQAAPVWEQGFAALASGDAAARAAAVAAFLASVRDPATVHRISFDLLAALGARREVLALLPVTFWRQRPDLTRQVLMSPLLAPARADPAFTAAAEKFGLINYWRTSGHKPDMCKAAAAPPLCKMLG